MPIVRMPDGTQVRFPDDMQREEIQSLIAGRFPDAVPAAPQPQTFSELREAGMLQQTPGNEDLWAPDAPAQPEIPASDIPSLPGVLGDVQNAERAFSNALTQGATFGFADEIAAALAAPVRSMAAGETLPEAYGNQISDIRAIEDALAEDNPVASTLGNVAGAVGSGVGLARNGLTLMNAARPTASSMGLRGMTEGALYGGLHGFGAGDTMDERIAGAIDGGLMGGGIGGALGAGAGALANRAANAAAPTIDELRAQASGLYDAARNSNVVFPQATVQQAADDIAARAISEGLDETLHPGAAAALRRLQSAAGQGLTAQQAQTLRRVIAAAGKSPTNPDQGRIAGEMVRMFDDQITGSIPSLAAANATYATARRGQLIEDAFTRARDAMGSNYNNAGFVTALRQQFRSLLNNQNAMRGFSEAEQQALRDFVRGGPAENFLRWAGRFAPTGVVSTAGTVGSGAGLGMLAGSPTAGAVAAGGLGLAGMAARGAGNAMAMNNAQRIAALIRSGGAAPTLSPARLAVVDALISGQASEAHEIPANTNAAIRALLTGTSL